MSPAWAVAEPYKPRARMHTATVLICHARLRICSTCFPGAYSARAYSASSHRDRRLRSLPNETSPDLRRKYDGTHKGSPRTFARGSRMTRNLEPSGRGAVDGATFRLRTQAGMGFAPEHTVLLVIDPVNDFLSEGGAAWDLTRNTVRRHDVVGNLRRAIDGARARGVPVIFAPMAYTLEDYAEHELHRRNGIHRIQFERKMFLAGSWGADFHPQLQPQSTDIILLPHKGTDVFRTDLPEHLARLGTTQLVIAGMTANLCVESTGRHAAEEGYDVTFLADAIGSENIPSYEAAVRVNLPLIGNAVMTVEEFLGAIGRATAAPKPGDIVRGSDNVRVGKVKKVVGATASHEEHIVLRHALLFWRTLYIPMEAVSRRAGDTIFINVPGLVVPKMPWKKPPSRANRAVQEGKPAADVDRLYGEHAPTAHAPK